MRVIATAPTRIDLSGGTLDLWPIHHLLPNKATVNCAINLDSETIVEISSNNYTEITSVDLKKTISGSFTDISQSKELQLASLLLNALWTKDLPNLKITTSAKSPAGAGLGGSSCLGLTIAGALTELRVKYDSLYSITERELIQTVQNAESKLIHSPTGCQDYWAAKRGGINIITYLFSRIEIETLDTAILPELNDNLIICYSGQARDSAINNWEIFKKLFNKEKEIFEVFCKIGECASRCAAAIKNKNWNAVLEASEQEWELRLSLWPNINTKITANIGDKAVDAGALFYRVCGAGGGGVMAIFAPNEKHDAVKRAIESAGGKVLNAQVVNRGLTIS